MSQPMPERDLVVGVLLAGGQARRMGGGDKCLRELQGKPLLHHIRESIAPQVGTLILNANGDPARFSSENLPVVPDVIEGYAGPLAGILTGLEWMREHRPQSSWLLSCPTDAPFLPPDLAVRFFKSCRETGAELAVAASAGRHHPVVGLWPVALADALRDAVENEGIRKIDVWTARYKLTEVTWPAEPIDPFFNANRPEDLATAATLMQG